MVANYSQYKSTKVANFFLIIFSGSAIFPRMDKELTAAQVAERLDVGRSTVNLWCRQGKFPGARVEASPVGDYWMIPEKDVRDFQPPTKGRPPKSLPATQKRATGHASARHGTATKKKGGKK